MKLWLLLSRDSDPHWEPWYDKQFGFVVRAETEDGARAAAHADAGDENHSGRTPWLLAEHSTCEELSAEGAPGVVMSDYRSA